MWREDAKDPFAWEEDSDSWGLVCGEEAGFFVVDIDKKSGGLDTLASMSLPDTFHWQTQGGGFHYFFKWPKGQNVRNKVGFLPGWDIRGTGGYVICYGDPIVIPEHSFLEAPEWLLTLVTQEDKVSSTLANAVAEIAEGGRNHYLSALAGRMRRSDCLSLAGLMEFNEQRCDPPLSQNEVTLIYNSIMRYQPDAEAASVEVMDFTQLSWASSMVKPVMDWLKNKNTTVGTPTGLEELDKLLGGGKRLGELTVICAAAKTGKNSFLHWLMMPWLAAGVPVGYASREMSPEIEVLPNLLTLALGKNAYTDSSITEEEVVEAMLEWKLAFAPGYGIILPKELFSWLDACRAAGIQHVLVDHLHFCLSDPEDYKQISVFIRDLKGYARAHNIHIDLIVQPKQTQAGERLNMYSMRGGAALSQALDNLILMERERDNDGMLIDITSITLEVARSKLAKTGRFYLGYDKPTMVFNVVEPAAANSGRPLFGQCAPPPNFVPTIQTEKRETNNNVDFVDGSKVASNIVKRLNISKDN